jgi:hypothetical protein
LFDGSLRVTESVRNALFNLVSIGPAISAWRFGNPAAI